MKNRYLKAGLAGIGLIGGAVVGLMLYAMTELPIVELIMCSSGEGGIRLPSGLCEYYMKNYRGNDEDMEELAFGGLDPILNGESKKKYDIAEFFIAKGLDVNGVNHYGEPNHVTPLHASVLYNDAERAKFLIDHGADVSIKIKSRSYNDMTALELAQALQKKRPAEDRSELIRLLSHPPPATAVPAN